MAFQTWDAFLDELGALTSAQVTAILTSWSMLLAGFGTPFMQLLNPPNFDNMICNADFELDSNNDNKPDDWDAITEAGTPTFTKSDIGTKGKWCATITCAIGDAGRYDHHNLIPILGSTAYVLSCQTGQNYTNGTISVRVYWFDKTKTLCSTPYSTAYDGAAEGTGWRTKNAVVTSPSDARYAKPSLILNCVGASAGNSAFFDDVKFSHQLTTNWLTDAIFTGASGLAKFTANFWSDATKFADNVFTWQKVAVDFLGLLLGNKPANVDTVQSGIDDSIWYTYADSGCAITNDMESGKPVLKLSVDATTNHYAYIASKNAHYNPTIAKFNIVVKAKVTDSTPDFYIGTASGSIGYIMFNYDGSTLSSVTTGNDGNSETHEITGIDVSAYHVYHIECLESSVKFYIDGTLKTTHTTHIPDDAYPQVGLRSNGAAKDLFCAGFISVEI
jgi:hypothetical protein